MEEFCGNSMREISALIYMLGTANSPDSLAYTTLEILFFSLSTCSIPPHALQSCARLKLATEIELVADESDENADCLRPHKRSIR